MRFLPSTTIFLGSFLAFLVQPLTARALLPSFGGTAAVWVTCLSAFQLLLVAGYGYAHMLAPGRLRLHLLLLLAAAAWLGAVSFLFPVIASRLGASASPTLGTLAAVAIVAGVPYVLFASNASLVQRLSGGAYRLYAVSNAGSFAGLFAHPLVLEPFVHVAWQWRILAFGAVAYAALVYALGRSARSAEGRVTAGPDARGGEAKGVSPLAWALPAASCFLLNAATAHVTADVVPLPLVWAVMLGVYLLTFSVGFSALGERLLPLWSALAFVAAASAAAARFGPALSRPRIAMDMASTLALVAFGGSAMHAWLCSLRPSARLLSRYNLAIAAGGAAGGLLAGVALPVLSDSVVEWPVAVALAAGLAIAGARAWAVRRFGGLPAWTAKAGAFLFALAAFAAWVGEGLARHGDLARGRSFYGAWRVYRETLTNAYGKKVDVYGFRHGGTLHGLEPVDPFYRDTATAYYGRGGGGLAFTTHALYRAGRPMRVGMIGLGVGTLAFYGREGDTLRFYEICPQVAAVAHGKWFDYLANCRARVDVSIGDARRTLEDERTAGAAKWDLLVVDAYSGDSIPLQLVTEEAFRLYRERLADGGTLALHLSNWHVDLVPAAKAAAKLLGMSCQVVSEPANGFSSASTWAFLSERPLPLPPETYAVPLDEVPDMPLPRDYCGGLAPFVRIML